ncbi:hypothetical protein FO440_22595 [Mucilaginibacter corticis]|uniref:DUF5010 domain-containing protein n=1 Tax=Mucilaginibacter corticis TaxID=2597670 RepID=A0A556M9M9_9SPHI|nr:hypothetical protein [Mucilaginibacter corticis]TSJ36619.1 hypothetical protein FO440_22595 [Mucilaginibacter corticis]
MKKLLFGLALLPHLLFAQFVVPNYPAVDALGRKLPDFKDVGPPRKNKFVGLFYWVWHTNFASQVPLNTSEILAKHPEAVYDYDNPVWRPADGTTFYWGEPLFGYYRDEDPWVLRRQAVMLADAGVDVIILDSTNGTNFKESYEALFKAFDEARKDGIKAPAIAFILPFGPSESAKGELVQLYNDLYKPGLYKDLWFNWQGKPLIMAYPEMVSSPDDTGLNAAIKNFFTFRPGQPVYNKGPQHKDHWGWLEVYPQHGFGPKPNGAFEEVTVGVAQNWSKKEGLTAMNAEGAFGRNYTDKDGQHTEPGAINYGYNFQEQWDRALKIDPDFIFITGWNEWIAGRAKKWQNQVNAFPDEFNEEGSRDIEPMKGGHGDNYYYQMVSNIRKFKGMAAPAEAGGYVKANADGSFVDWDKVKPEFVAYKGNTLHRDFDGWKGTHYVNNTGRNDLVLSKVAVDKQFVYFYVQTQDKLSPATDKAWMRLFINIDKNNQTGWNGYDYVINRLNPTAKGTVERSVNGWKWNKVGDAGYRIKDNVLELKIDKKLLGVSGPADFEFKWSDNMQTDGDITDFLINGDVAPSGRFNFRYINKMK